MDVLRKLGIQINVSGNTAGLKKFENGIDGITSKAKTLGSVLVGVLGVHTLGRVLNSAIDDFDAQAEAIAQVEAGIKATGNAAGITVEEFKNMASELQKVTRFGDEEILGGVIQQLQTFPKIAGDMFRRATKITVDIATKTKNDVKSTAIQVGKILQDPIGQLAALGRAGILFSEAEEKLIKGLAQTNRLAEAQSVILSVMEEQYGGAAEAAGKAGKGPFIRFKNILNDINEQFGEMISTRLNKFLGFLEPIITKLKDLNETSGVLTRSLDILGIAAVFAARKMLVSFALAAAPFALIALFLGATYLFLDDIYNFFTGNKKSLLEEWIKDVYGIEKGAEFVERMRDGFKSMLPFVNRLLDPFQSLTDFFDHWIEGFKIIAKFIPGITGLTANAVQQAALGNPLGGINAPSEDVREAIRKQGEAFATRRGIIEQAPSAPLSRADLNALFPTAGIFSPTASSTSNNAVTNNVTVNVNGGNPQEVEAAVTRALNKEVTTHKENFRTLKEAQ